MNDLEILKTIGLIRESFDDSVKVFTEGSCVKFCMILQHLYPDGSILYDMNHAIFQYGHNCFDINGYTTKTLNHIPLEAYGLLKSYEIMNLKYNKL